MPLDLWNDRHAAPRAAEIHRISGGHGIRGAGWILLAALALAGVPAAAQAPRPVLPEYQLKARFVHVLLGYITWTASANRPLVLGVLGRHKFKDYLTLEMTPNGETPCRVKYFTELKDLEACDAVFICNSEADRLDLVLARLRGRPVLTFGDTQGFARHGVMVNFYLEADSVRFEINVPAFRASGLQISTPVLRRARIID